MIIVMPDNPRGLDFLRNEYLETKDTPELENIFEAATQALDNKRKNSDEYSVVMPKFTIDSSISAGDYFRKVGCNSLPEIELRNQFFVEFIGASSVGRTRARRCSV